MHVELLPESAQRLVRASCHPRQELVLGYWRELLDRPVDEIAEIATAAMTAVRLSGVPYLLVAGSDLEPDCWRPRCLHTDRQPSVKMVRQHSTVMDSRA
jgi:hypothetical protein